MDSGLLKNAYYTDANVWLLLGDAVEMMNQLPDASVDMVFADPPYYLSNDGFTCIAGKRASVNKGLWDVSKGIGHDFQFHFDWIDACRRILKPNGTIWISGTYHSIYACGYALQLQGRHIINDICWFKPNASPNLSCRMFTASHEMLIWARKSRKAHHYFDYRLSRNGLWEGDCLKKPDTQMRSVWSITPPRQNEKQFGKHPTQKPLALLERIILLTTHSGDIILDPFCGSATTGVAAVKNSRAFIGIDNDKAYLDDLAIRRMEVARIFEG